MIDTLIGPVAGLLDKFIEDKDQKSEVGARYCDDGRASRA